ncbi:MAG: nucleotidyltransferase [bacterium]|nr:nucleotidyltransferase [bacterium]
MFEPPKPIEREEEQREILSKEEIMAILTRERDVFKNKFNVRKMGLLASYGKKSKTTMIGDIDLHVEFEEYLYDTFMDLTYYLEDLFDRQVDLIMARTIKSHVKPYRISQVQFVEGLDGY